MRDWLTIEFVLATLLVTSYVCIGLLAMWAATSPRHWFVRAVVVLVLLAPFLMVPAYELFLGPLLAIGVVCFAVAMRRLIVQARIQSRSTLGLVNALPRRFSLQTTLLATSLLAAAIALVARIPSETWVTWLVWSQCGVAIGPSIFMTAMVRDGSSSWWVRLSYVLSIAGFVCLPFTTYTVALVTFIDIWSDTSTAITSFRIFSCIAAAFIAVLMLLAGLVLMDRATAFNATPDVWNAGAGRLRVRKRRLLFVGFLCLMAGPPCILLGELLRPMPILADSIPNPNGLHRLVEIGKRLENSAVVREYGADPVNHVKLAAAVSRQASDYVEIRSALAMPCWLPVYYDEERYFAEMGRMTAGRKILYALDAKGDVLLQSSDIDEALATFADMLQFAEAMHCGGLALDYLFATACEETAYEQIYRSIRSLNAKQSFTLLDELSAFDLRRREIDDVLYRERVWMQRAHGWSGHLVELMGRFALNDDSRWNVFDGVENAHRRSQAISRMLIVELALRTFQLEHNKLPETLDELVPWYLPQALVDPFDSERRSFRYKRTDAGYVLYSVGPDKSDDGGTAMVGRELPGISSAAQRGDLRLDGYFQAK